MATAYDLTSASGVQQFLADTQFASTRVAVLAGGTGNFAYRLHLSAPYDGRTTLVLKHAQPYAALSPEIPLAIARQAFEAKALEKVRQSPVCGPLATVPELHHFDENAHILIMDDCGEDALNLKQLMLTAAPSPAVAREIGSALGQFLGRLHSWGTANQALLDYFDKNQLGKDITAWITYGRLISTLTTDNLPAVALLPQQVSESDLNAIRAIVDERTAEIRTSRSAFTMGDFWTGNIMVNICSDPATGAPSFAGVHVIDWEIAKPGVPALDVGQFCAEMHCVTLFKPEAADSASALIAAFLTAYRAHCGTLTPYLPNIAAKHLGAHLVTITPRVGWGPPEQTVKAIQEGLTYLIKGSSDRWVREESVFAPLL
ncbi:kinase-like domain-containing protein [Mycena pura]|uniref:Kinase-like domain-containing protein n=1 Tax=Mycena pura TaxID=153505 RepID=A0AAD6VKD5_9AGAR|nr:kinase-like domain-containing protein [Mycena pura]